MSAAALACDPVPVPRRTTARRLVALGLAELVGTALLVGVGLSIVIVDLGKGAPLPAVLPSPLARRALTGVLFGSVGASIALSPVGRTSGAHINPVVSLVFWLDGALPTAAFGVYVLGQAIGAIIGAIPLALFGSMGRSVSFGATVPGPQGAPLAALAEAGCTLALVVALLSFVARPALRRYTPAIFPVLYGVLVAFEAPVSGTSTNPARSLGPAVVFDIWSGFWVYVVGPTAGALLGAGLRRLLAGGRPQLRIELAKIAHFESDPFAPLAHLHHLPQTGLGRGPGRPGPVGTRAGRPGQDLRPGSHP